MGIEDYVFKPVRAATAVERDIHYSSVRDRSPPPMPPRVDPPLNQKRRDRQPDGRIGVLVRTMPSTHYALKRYALDAGQTLQDVMDGMIEDFLHSKGRAPRRNGT